MDMAARLIFAFWIGLMGFVPLARGQSGKWESEIVRLEAGLREAPPGAGAVVLYGSSSFRLWTNAVAAFPGHRVVNLGFGGSQLSDLNAFYDRLVRPLEPGILLIYGGDNDLASGKSPAQVEKDFRELVGRVRATSPRTRIAFVAVKPSPSRRNLLGAQREANARVKKFAAWRRRVDFVDVATPLLDSLGEPVPVFFIQDRLHLNGRGYEVWRGVVEPYLRRWDR